MMIEQLIHISHISHIYIYHIFFGWVLPEIMWNVIQTSNNIKCWLIFSHCLMKCDLWFTQIICMFCHLKPILLWPPSLFLCHIAGEGHNGLVLLQCQTTVSALCLLKKFMPVNIFLNKPGIKLNFVKSPQIQKLNIYCSYLNNIYDRHQYRYQTYMWYLFLILSL